MALGTAALEGEPAVGEKEAIATEEAGEAEREEEEEVPEGWVSSFAAPPEGAECEDEEECVIPFDEDDEEDGA